MRDTLDNFIYGYFPAITSLEKSGLFFLTQEQGNVNLLGYYLLGSALWDSGEILFNQNPETPRYCFEERLYHIRTLMDIIQDTAFDLSMTVRGWADKIRRR